MESQQEEKSVRGVGRPREFDITEMLEVVTKAFWDEGYSATSLSDLMDVTGLKKGSLYAAYGDKHTLFLKCLKSYLKDRLQHMELHFLDLSDPILKLKEWLKDATRRQSAPAQPSLPCGCFAINSMVELGPHDTDVKALLDSHFKSVEDLLTQAIDQGQKSNLLRSGPARIQAKLLLTVAAGLAAKARSHPETETDSKLRSYIIELISA